MRSKCILLFRALVVCLGSLSFFHVSAAGAAETVLVPEGATWKYYIGTNEPSPADIPAWRQKDFNDVNWPSGQMPIGYSSAAPRTGHEATIATQITPTGVGVTLYFRKTFVLNNLANLTGLNWTVWVDDGAVISINGEEVGRLNAPPTGELAYNAACLTPGQEVTMSGTYTNISNLLVGDNVLTIHALNSATASSDLFAEATLSAVRDIEAPTVVDLIPEPGSTNRILNEIEVFFSEPVTGVDASDLLINGLPATDLEFGVPGQFLFTFPAAATGTITVQWASNHGITDLAPIPHPFVAGAPWTYVVDPSQPPDLILNEFLAVNQNGIHDEDGDSSDWIEIYNPGNTIRDLGGWFLTDSAGDLTKWRVPTTAPPVV